MLEMLNNCRRHCCRRLLAGVLRRVPCVLLPSLSHLYYHATSAHDTLFLHYSSYDVSEGLSNVNVRRLFTYATERTPVILD